MSKLAKGLAVGTLAAGFAVLAGTGQVSASAAYGGWQMPDMGNMKVWHESDHGYKGGKDGHHYDFGGRTNFSFNDVSFNESYDKNRSMFYNLKTDEKKTDSEHFSSDNYNQNAGKGWGHGGFTNAVSVDYNRDMSSYKSLEETKKLHESESYAANYDQSSARYDFGQGRGHGLNLAATNVSASVNFNKEYDYAASVKAVASHNASVGSSVNVVNTGPWGGNASSVSAYENVDNYSRVEASVAESVKQEQAVNYNASTLNANQGNWGGGNVAASNVDYNAYSNYEANREVTYVAEESNSYSSGFEANNASYNLGGYGGGHKY
jgi:hypothetical protein